MSSNMTRRKTHPGIILKAEYMEPLNLSSKGMAHLLGIRIEELYDLTNEQAGLTPELCKRLAVLFNTTEQFWLNMQTNYDESLDL